MFQIKIVEMFSNDSMAACLLIYDNGIDIHV